MKLFNKTKDEYTTTTRMNYLPIYLGFISIFISLSFLTYTTLALFRDSALTKGSEISAGSLYIDLLATDDYLDEIGYEGDKTQFKTYTRKVNDVSEDYYIITDSDLPIITINNVEPGQIYPVKFSIVNLGGLAVKYSAAFNVEEDDEGNKLSFTGLETLEKEKDSLTVNDYNFLKKVLEAKQLDDEGNDIGGHLEDVLDVYIGTCDDDVKESNYVGKLSDILDGDINVYNGFSLALNELEIIDGNIIPQNVDIYSNGTLYNTLRDVTEIGELNYLIKMPEDATSIYEYASLTFSLGVSATQAEYEYDGINRKIYDSFGWADDSNRCIIIKNPVFNSDFAMNSMVVYTNEEERGTCNQGNLYFYIVKSSGDINPNFRPQSPKTNMDGWYTYEELKAGQVAGGINRTEPGYSYAAYCCAYDPTNPNSIPSGILYMGQKSVTNSR